MSYDKLVYDLEGKNTIQRKHIRSAPGLTSMPFPLRCFEAF